LPEPVGVFQDDVLYSKTLRGSRPPLAPGIVAAAWLSGIFEKAPEQQIMPDGRLSGI